MKKISLFVLLVVAGLFLSCGSMNSTLRRGEAVAVWDFDDLSPGPPGRLPVGDILSDAVIETLKRKEYTVVERSRLSLALEELNLGTTSLVDETTRLKLGRIVGARYMVFGVYQVIGNQMRLDIRLVETETARVRKAIQRSASGTDVMSWIAVVKEAAEELK